MGLTFGAENLYNVTRWTPSRLIQRRGESHMWKSQTVGSALLHKLTWCHGLTLVEITVCGIRRYDDVGCVQVSNKNNNNNNSIFFPNSNRPVSEPELCCWELYFSTPRDSMAWAHCSCSAAFPKLRSPVSSRNRKYGLTDFVEIIISILIPDNGLTMSPVLPHWWLCGYQNWKIKLITKQKRGTLNVDGF